MQQIDEFAKKKNLLLTSVEKDVKGFDDLSVQAEAEKNFSIFHMSNSFKGLVKQTQGIKCLTWTREKFET